MLNMTNLVDISIDEMTLKTKVVSAEVDLELTAVNIQNDIANERIVIENMLGFQQCYKNFMEDPENITVKEAYLTCQDNSKNELFKRTGFTETPNFCSIGRTMTGDKILEDVMKILKFSKTREAAQSVEVWSNEKSNRCHMVIEGLISAYCETYEVPPHAFDTFEIMEEWVSKMKV